MRLTASYEASVAFPTIYVLLSRVAPHIYLLVMEHYDTSSVEKNDPAAVFYDSFAIIYWFIAAVIYFTTPAIWNF
jgi:hypothetical protein